MMGPMSGVENIKDVKGETWTFSRDLAGIHIYRAMTLTGRALIRAGPEAGHARYGERLTPLQVHLIRD